MVPQLSLEIWTNVMAFLKRPIPDAGTRANRKALCQPDLVRCMRINSLLNHATAPILYAEPAFHDWVRFARGINNAIMDGRLSLTKSECLRYVRRLYLSPIPVHISAFAVDDDIATAASSVMGGFCVDLGMTGEERSIAKSRANFKQRAELEYRLLQAQLGAIIALTESARGQHPFPSDPLPFARVRMILNGVHERPSLDWIDNDGVGYETFFLPFENADKGLDPPQVIRNFLAALNCSSYCEHVCSEEVGYPSDRNALDCTWTPLDTVRLGQQVTLHIGDRFSDLVPITDTPCDIIFHHEQRHHGRSRPDYVGMARRALTILDYFQDQRKKHRGRSIVPPKNARLDITLHIPPAENRLTEKRHQVDEAEIRAKAAELVKKGKDYGDRVEISWNSSKICGACGL